MLLPHEVPQVRQMLQEADCLLKQAQLKVKQQQESTGEMVKGITVTDDNKLVISGDFLPNWYEMRDAVEAFVIRNVLYQTAGNLTKAGKLLGISKVHVLDRKRKHGL